MLKGRIKSGKICVLVTLIYILVVSLIDTYSYGIIYQQKIQRENYDSKVWSWVFEEKAPVDGEQYVTVPRYRVIQKFIEISGIILILYLCGIYAAVGLLVSHYFMTYDLLFYIFLGQTHLFSEFDKAYDVYWLKNWYQLGYFIFRPFREEYFYASGILGGVIAILSGFIKKRK